MTEPKRFPALRWHISSHSGSNNSCVAAALLPDGGIAVRNSTRPDEPPVTFTPSEWDAFVAGVKDGEFDRGSLPT